MKIIYMSCILDLLHNFRPIYQNKCYFITLVPALFSNRSNLLLGFNATNKVYFRKIFNKIAKLRINAVCQDTTYHSIPLRAAEMTDPFKVTHQ